MLQVSMGAHTGMFASMEDHALLDAAKHLVIEEHLATAALLRALMEIDTRRLYLGEGSASMFWGGLVPERADRVTCHGVISA
jgi:hypothetical protein